MAVAPLPLGPFVTLAVWLAITVVIVSVQRRARRRAPDAEAEAEPLPWFELVPIVVAVGMIQLLLDLHRPGLGDVAAGGAHLVALVVLGLRWHRRRRRPP